MEYKLSNTVNRFIKSLSKYGYKCSKSKISPGHSYYFKCERMLTIRLSDHHLHPNQERLNQIDIIINDNEKIVNGKEIFATNISAKELSKIATERIVLEHALYGKPMPLSRR